MILRQTAETSPAPSLDLCARSRVSLSSISFLSLHTQTLIIFNASPNTYLVWGKFQILSSFLYILRSCGLIVDSPLFDSYAVSLTLAFTLFLKLRNKTLKKNGKMVKNACEFVGLKIVAYFEGKQLG